MYHTEITLILSFVMLTFIITLFILVFTEHTSTFYM